MFRQADQIFVAIQRHNVLMHRKISDSNRFSTIWVGLECHARSLCPMQDAGRNGQPLDDSFQLALQGFVGQVALLVKSTGGF
jgi:hypothetical protein